MYIYIYIYIYIYMYIYVYEHKFSVESQWVNVVTIYFLVKPPSFSRHYHRRLGKLTPMH